MSFRWKPRPGWMTVTRIETEESFSGSPLVIPQQARDRLSRWQYVVVESGGAAPVEEDEKPGVPHDFQEGAWILCPPRSAMNVDEEGIVLLDEKLAWAYVSEGRTGSPASPD